jgi:hypothetical protein
MAAASSSISYCGLCGRWSFGYWEIRQFWQWAERGLQPKVAIE